MGLLDQIIGGVINSRMGGGGMGGGGMGGGLGGGLGGGMGRSGGGSPLMMALMALLSSGALSGSGGLGGLLGGLTGGGASARDRDDDERRRGGGRRRREAETDGGGFGGGLSGLLDSLTRSGHGEVADSWVNHGPNRRIEPQQLDQALGRDTIDRLQRETGMERGDLLSQLSELLPDVVDKLTPQGRRPNQDEMSRW